MKKRALISLLCGIMILSIVSCTIKVTPNTNIQNIEGNGNLIINSNLMNSLRSLGVNYELVPLEYGGGIVRGIVSPTKIDQYMLQSNYSNNILNPIKYTEYIIDGFDRFSFLKETGEIINLSEILSYRLNVENPKNITLKDRKRKIEKTYISKIATNFVVNKEDSYSSNNGPMKIDRIYDKDGKEINVSYSQEKVFGKDNRYVYSDFGYTNELDENGNGKNYFRVNIIYDSKTESFYESDPVKITNYIYGGDEIYEINNEIYNFSRDGKINKVILNDGKILLEEYYDFELKENEEINMSYGYTNNTIWGNEIFISKFLRVSESSSTGLVDSVFNVKDRTIVDLPGIIESQTRIDKIFSNSDNLAMISINNYGSEAVWIARYEGGKFNNLVQIDKYSSNATPILSKNIEDILYDNETNSFFIKRKISIDKKQSYQYEVLKLE